MTQINIEKFIASVIKGAKALEDAGFTPTLSVVLEAALREQCLDYENGKIVEININEPIVPEDGKYYKCIKDFFSEGKKFSSEGDIVQAKNGSAIMSLKDASMYFREATADELRENDMKVLAELKESLSEEKEKMPNKFIQQSSEELIPVQPMKEPEYLMKELEEPQEKNDEIIPNNEGQPTNNNEAENKFKVGDKVKIHCRPNADPSDIRIYEGKIGKVKNVWNLERNPWGNIVVRLDNGCNSGFLESELTLVDDENPEEYIPKFKVGDVIENKYNSHLIYKIKDLDFNSKNYVCEHVGVNQGTSDYIGFLIVDEDYELYNDQPNQEGDEGEGMFGDGLDHYEIEIPDGYVAHISGNKIVLDKFKQ